MEVVTGMARMQAGTNVKISKFNQKCKSHSPDMSANSDQDSRCEYTDLHAYVMCLHTGSLWKAPQVKDAAAIPYPREENE